MANMIRAMAPPPQLCQSQWLPPTPCQPASSILGLAGKPVLQPEEQPQTDGRSSWFSWRRHRKQPALECLGASGTRCEQRGRDQETGMVQVRGVCGCVQMRPQGCRLMLSQGGGGRHRRRQAHRPPPLAECWPRPTIRRRNTRL